jgi:protein-tyrosine-phosphatase
VKSKAVEAMSKDGVDISLYQPKTIDEILPVLTNEAKALSVEKDDVTSQININNKILVNAVIEEMDSAPTKSVDKLIVLCSCGEELKYELTRRSKSVEEWSIDAPTAASKAGEGDQAYQRVSLEIKKEVNILMGSLLPKPFF